MNEKKTVAVDYKLAGFDNSFDKVLLAYGRALEQKKAAGAVIAAIKGKLDAALAAKKHVSVYNDLWQVTRSEGKAGARKIDGARLLEKGVSTEIIKYATLTGEQGKPYILITARGAGEAESEG